VSTRKKITDLNGSLLTQYLGMLAYLRRRTFIDPSLDRTRPPTLRFSSALPTRSKSTPLTCSTTEATCPVDQPRTQPDWIYSIGRWRSGCLRSRLRIIPSQVCHFLDTNYIGVIHVDDGHSCLGADSLYRQSSHCHGLSLLSLLSYSCALLAFLL
jgi:hypothetical protein